MAADQAADEAARIAQILEANPDGISRAGLMAWAHLRVAPDLTDEQLDAALAELGPAVSVEGGFVRLVAANGRLPLDPAARPPRWAAPASGASDRPEVSVPEGAAETHARSDGAFSTASLVDTTAPPRGWVGGSRPRRGLGALMTIGSFVVLGGLTLLARTGSDGSSAGPTLVPSDPRGSIIAGGELAVGSCFVIPTATTFLEVESRPCEAPHDGEVVATWDVSAQPGASYPSDAQWTSSARARCETAFESYTGQAYATQSELDYDWFVPAEDSWAHGSRNIECFLKPASGGLLSRSYRAGS